MTHDPHQCDCEACKRKRRDRINFVLAALRRRDVVGAALCALSEDELCFIYSEREHPLSLTDGGTRAFLKLFDYICDPEQVLEAV